MNEFRDFISLFILKSTVCIGFCTWNGHEPLLSVMWLKTRHQNARRHRAYIATIYNLTLRCLWGLCHVLARWWITKHVCVLSLIHSAVRTDEWFSFKNVMTQYHWHQLIFIDEPWRWLNFEIETWPRFLNRNIRSIAN